MTLESILHLLRNPYGHPQGTLRQSRLEAAEMLEKLSKQLAAPAAPVQPNIRDAFEEFGRSMDWDLERVGHGYSDCNIDYAWTGYVAALRDRMAAPQGASK